MRALVVVCALGSLAHADAPGDVTKEVHEAIIEHGFMGVTVYGPDGNELNSEAANDLLFGNSPKLGKLTVGVIAERPVVAWFQGPLTVGKQAYRISGIVDQDRVSTVTLSRVVSDADLIAAAKKAGQAVPAKALEGDDTTGRAAYWVSHGFAPPPVLGWPTVVVASGTAPSEYAVGQAAVKKLVAGWDKLGLVPVAGETVGDVGRLHVVHLHVMMPIKKSKIAVPMVMTAIVDSDGTYWQWVSLQFSPIL